MANVSGMSAFYASIGSRLDAYSLDVEGQRLSRLGTWQLPASIQYAAPHPDLPFLYVASSNQFSPGLRDRHEVSVFRIDRRNGVLTPAGQGIRLHARPIHITIAPGGDYALVAYNNPSGVTVHPIDGNGAIGPALPQQADIDTGTYAHQVRLLPSGRAALLVTRGNPPANGKPAEPGALKLYGFDHGQLSASQSIRPKSHDGFGPRHVDFHPTKPWMYVSVETQNQLQAYRLEGDEISAEPFSVTTTLETPSILAGSQLAGAIHMHPGGRFVYVANRSDASRQHEGRAVYAGGENTIAVFSIHPDTGVPALVQSVDTHGIHARTFSLDPGGRLLIAANTVSLWRHSEGNFSRIPAGFSIYRLAEDGTMTFSGKIDVETGDGGWGESLFWSAIVELR